MARIYKRDRKWYVDFSLDGRRYRRSLGVIYKEAAEAARRRVELAVADGRDPFADYDVPLAELLGEYLTYCEARNQRQTVVDKRRHAEHFEGFLRADTGVSKITRADVESYVSRRLKDASGTTVNRELTTLKHFFNFARDRGLVERNPVKGVKKLPEERRPIKILSKDELDRYFAYCKDNDPLLYDLSVLALYTGLRRGDIMKIRGADINPGQRIIVVSVSKRNRELILYLPLNEAALGVLKRRKKEYGDGYIFPGKNGDHITDFKKRFQSAKEETGVNFRFMEFRHNCATRLLETGADIVTVQEILGHSAITTTTRYLKLADKRKREALERL